MHSGKIRFESDKMLDNFMCNFKVVSIIGLDKFHKVPGEEGVATFDSLQDLDMTNLKALLLSFCGKLE